MLANPELFGLTRTPDDPRGTTGLISVSTGVLGLREPLDESGKPTGQIGMTCWLCHGAANPVDGARVLGLPGVAFDYGLLLATAAVLDDDNAEAAAHRKARGFPAGRTVRARLLLAGPGRQDLTGEFGLDVTVPGYRSARYPGTARVRQGTRGIVEPDQRARRFSPRRGWRSRTGPAPRRRTRRGWIGCWPWWAAPTRCRRRGSAWRRPGEPDRPGLRGDAAPQPALRSAQPGDARTPAGLVPRAPVGGRRLRPRHAAARRDARHSSHVRGGADPTDHWSRAARPRAERLRAPDAKRGAGGARTGDLRGDVRRHHREPPGPEAGPRPLRRRQAGGARAGADRSVAAAGGAPAGALRRLPLGGAARRQAADRPTTRPRSGAAPTAT